jgi:hypothetical protein
MYIATTTLDEPAADPQTVLLHNAPGRAVAVHPATGREGAAFIFRHGPLPDATDSDPQLHKQLVTAAYAGMGWRVPELLERVRATDDLYFDSVSRVRLDTWSQDRGGRSWSATPRAVPRCSVRAPAWPSSARRPLPRHSQPSPPIPRQHYATTNTTTAERGARVPPARPGNPQQNHRPQHRTTTVADHRRRSASRAPQRRHRVEAAPGRGPVNLAFPSAVHARADPCPPAAPPG